MKYFVLIFMTILILGSLVQGESESNISEEILKDRDVTVKDENNEMAALTLSDNDRQDDEKASQSEGKILKTNREEKEKLYFGSNRDHKMNSEEREKAREKMMQRYLEEVQAGNPAEIVGTNPHYYQPTQYNDLGRRFVPQYKYAEIVKDVSTAPRGDEILPQMAPAELVLLVAKESALLEASKPRDYKEEVEQKNQILRSGNFWNSVWKEDVDPKSILRNGIESIPEKNTMNYWNNGWKGKAPPKGILRNDLERRQKQVLGTIKTEIKPGTILHDVVTSLKKLSPRLVYIINKRNK